MDDSGTPVVWINCDWAWGGETVVVAVAGVPASWTSSGWAYGVETVTVDVAGVRWKAAWWTTPAKPM